MPDCKAMYEQVHAASCRLGPESMHMWDRINGWTGRYRCAFCQAIGHKSKLVIANSLMKYADDIVPYVCQRKGCPHHAVSRNPQRCREHQRTP